MHDRTFRSNPRGTDRRIGHVVLACVLLAGTLAAAVASGGESARVVAPGSAARASGFLEPAERPDSLALLPPPPRAGTAAYAADVEAYHTARLLRDTPRWQLAIADADVQFPRAAGIFECALGVAIDERETPSLYRLLQRTLIDAGQSTMGAKEQYQRPRPFAVFDQRMCVPADARALRKSGAYPSGHAAAGWAWALILAEVAPERADALLRRGYEFGASRVVCGVHWPSDVETGRTVGAAAVAKLHAKPEFVAQVSHARDEVRRARVAGRAPGRDCAAEARALGVDGR